MKRGLLVLLGGVNILLTYAGVRGQDAQIKPTLQLYLEMPSFSLLTDGVQDKLQTYGIVTEQTSELSNSDVAIFAGDFPDTVYVGVVNTVFELEQSPILVEEFSVATHLWTGYADFPKFVAAYGLYSLGRCEDAIAIFDSIVVPASATSQVWFYRGVCAMLNNESYERAAELFESAVFFNKGRSRAPCLLCDSAAVNLSWIYIEIGRKEEAYNLMERMVVIDIPDAAQYRSRVFTQRAQLYALVFRYDDAIGDMDAAIALDHDNPELYTLRGQIYLLLYEWDKVLADYNTAIELDHSYPDAYFYRGVLFYTQGPREDALADFERYLQLAPEDDHADEATKYAESIRIELDALND